MSETLGKIQRFLPVKVYDKESEFDESSFEIVDAETNEEIGSYSLNENGELVGFSLMDEPSKGNLQKEQMAEIAQKFVDTFYPDQKEFELSAILDLDNPYMISYEKRDEKYGIFIHSTGFTVSVSTSGQITSFYCADDEEYEVRYTDIVVSEEEALDKYINGIKFELSIQRFNRDIFENGDDQYHLAYSVIEQLMEIPVNGSESSSIREEFEMDSEIEKMVVHNHNIYELIGLTAGYKLLDKRVKEGKVIEIWSTLESIGEYSFDMEESDDHVIKLCFDEETNLLLQVVSGEEYNSGGEDIGVDRAKERALEVLFTLFPDAHERFRLEASETEMDNFEDEVEEVEDEGFTPDEFIDGEFEEENFDEDEWDEYIEQEDSYAFYIHVYHNGVRIDQHVSIIQVGQFTGKITHVNVDLPDADIFENLRTSPEVTIAEAKEIYKKHLKMELMFIREYDEDGKSIYTLAYTPSFPSTVGHVRAIDAITGKAMYVDVGDATFFS
ncbi:YcdB/YcdC domain-containing protein [Bacillus sinesaloumensis]|uniref:YcdB/YcdC domain-containing protein n=1 Tax=Litchfieldia sinesaloumensis TaxID=1926280 RepID=UPI00098850EB|nr:YcdB/YcdC domain-containing protein [Bacillus sinesaloumensis]